MAIQQLPSSPVRAVSVWVPNEVEGQILGGVSSHVDATHDACLPLLAHSAREGLGWVVRQEGEIRYLRATYSRPRDRVGTLYPDCLVAHGLPPLGDAPYDMTLPTMPAPLLIVEVISKKTRARDVGLKVQVYAQLGVREYVTFDPRPRKKLELRGYRLAAAGHYVPIPPDGGGGIWLAGVGLRLLGEAPAAPWEGGRLRYYTPVGERLLHIEEEAALRVEEQALRIEEQALRLKEQARRMEEQALRLEERERRIEAEARAARLEAQLAALGIRPQE